MNEDYLWDRSGERDAEIARLEEVLGKLRWSKETIRPQRRWRVWSVAAAAVVLVAIGAAFLWREKPAAATAWQLSRAPGTGSAIRRGEVIESGARSATIRSEFVGEVELDPDSRLRMVAAHEGLEQLALERGTIHAFIWAPPATFVVDTPSAKTVDLGCRYTLKVAPDGGGFLSVEMGWVAFEWHGIESFIPAGAVCATSAGHGPGIPYFNDAPAALARAVAEFDAHGGEVAARSVLAAARSRDALTIWHLMRRTQNMERAEAFERFAALVRLPAGITREAMLRGDPSATDAAWNAMQLGDMAWWRGWKQRW